MSIANETRRESYDRTLAGIGTQLRKVLLEVTANGPVSAWQLARIMGRNVYVIRPRLTELAAMGKIKEVGKRYESVTDRMEAVWDVADKQISLI